MKRTSIIFYSALVLFFCTKETFAQNYDLVSVSGVVSGDETSNALFKAYSNTIPSLAYIRAQKIKGPQDGVFTQSGDNIRYTAISSKDGMPSNLSSIRFCFLESDKKTLITPSNFRFVINDIDGPNNEALATNCTPNLRFLGTSNPTNLSVLNTDENIIAAGSREESDGPTSRVMFEFDGVAIIELDNYANDGYLKDFDMNGDYSISQPVLVKCKKESNNLIVKRDTVIVDNDKDFKSERNQVMMNTKPIYFDKDKFNIREDAEVVLNEVLNLLIKYPDLIIEIGSHTDARANDDYNLELSNNRAQSSIKWFINKGVKPSRVKGKGYGETQLVNNCSNGVHCTDKEHELNRRTEFVIVNPEVLEAK
ncbi:OmpA family protein [Lutibacter holmesii]|uniref:OmpA family protein n=1 Tax=Lutibacter holmesii TaxID=1137985 RepID=A0ABW3WSL5_9FLAO